MVNGRKSGKPQFQQEPLVWWFGGESAWELNALLSPAPRRQLVRKGRYDTILREQGDSEFVTLGIICVLIAPGLPLPVPNLPCPVRGGTPLRVGAVSDRSATDRVNTAAENPPAVDLSRTRLAQDEPGDARD
jgi:hypothetical protein